MRARSLFSAALIGVLIALSSASAANAAPGDWSDPVNVSAGERGLSPVLATTADGTVTATWQEFVGGSTALFAASSADDGVTWTAKQQLSSGPGWASGQVMATLGNGTITVVWNQNGLMSSTSVDGGVTWSGAVTLVPGGTGPGGQQLTSAAGHLVLAWFDYDGSLYVPMSSTSADGVVWSAPVVVPSPVGENVTNVTIAASGTVATIVVTTVLGADKTVSSSSSSDGGATWGSSVSIASSPNSLNLAGTVIAPSGALTAIWQDYNGVTSTLTASTSTTAGASWSAPVVLGIAGSGATIAVSPTGTLVAGWVDAPASRARVSVSTDIGQTWSAAQVVSTIGDTPYGLALAIENDGTIDAVVFGLLGASFFVTSVESTDDGTTWSAPTLLSDDGIEGLPATAVSARRVFVSWQGTPLAVVSRETSIAAVTTPAALAATGAEPLPWLLAALLLVAVGAGVRLRRSERA